MKPSYVANSMMDVLLISEQLLPPMLPAWRDLARMAAGLVENPTASHHALIAGNGIVNIGCFAEGCHKDLAEVFALSCIWKGAYDKRFYDKMFVGLTFAVNALLLHRLDLSRDTLLHRLRELHMADVWSPELAEAITADGIENCGWEDTVPPVGLRWLRITSAARCIQRAWHRAISDPTHTICRSRLLREFEDL